MIAYRIFDNKDGRPHTLFHGVNGSRKLETGKWIEAKVKNVTDGSGLTVYQSGFHVLSTKEEAISVLRDTFKNLDQRVVAKVQVRDTWPKKHSRHGVTLARFMKISEGDWKARQRVVKA